jgi:DnaJ-class molecular chaperone
MDEQLPMIVHYSCCTCNGTGLDDDRNRCLDCDGTGIDNHGA